MASEKLREELSEHFGEFVASDDALISQCVKMCQIFNMSGEDLFFKWEAFSFNSTPRPPFTMDSALALKAQIQRDIATKSMRKQQARTTLAENLNKARPSGLNRMHLRNIPSGSTSARAASGSMSAVVDGGESSAAGPSKVTFSGPKRDAASRKKRAYRYMYEKISERSEALDDRIEELSEIIKEHYKISDLGDPSASTEEDITIVGRITLDSESSSTGPVKLNEASLTLESSRMMGSGARVPLRFDPQVKVRGGAKGAGGLGLFPGAIVALKGKNGGAGWFLVNEIFSMPGLKVSPRSDIKADPGDASFSALITSGPYTPDTDLKYKPWHALLEVIKSAKPTVIILIGPFVDCSHPKIKNGDIDNPPEAIFRSQFLDSLHAALNASPGSLALLVPSVRDIISDHAVFPQCEISNAFAIYPRIHLLPNPCQITLNGVSFAVSSVDVLFHIRKEELFKRAEEVDSAPCNPNDSGSDAMSKLCRHVLHQRSFYPLFPTPIDVSHEVNLDVTHAAEGLKLSEDECAPDVLILPSRLKHFSKLVDGTTTVNPSFLTKGTYATLSYDGHGSGPVADRLTTQVLKLDS